MNVIAINGSPNKEGNTFHALNKVGEQLKQQGLEFKILHIGNKTVRGCIGCGKCRQNQNEKCVFDNDIVNESIGLMKNADGIILGAPVHYSGLPGTMKSFLDRVFYVAGSNGNLFRHKVGAALVAVRRSGGSSTLDSLYHFLSYSEMILATSNYWNITHGHTPGQAASDLEGNQIMEVLGANMAWILKMKELTQDTIPAPEKVKKVMTNFIR
jgi:multimeric flavodoxin WrbA